MIDKEIIAAQKTQIDNLYIALDERIQRIKVLEAEVGCETARIKRQEAEIVRLQGYNLCMARKHYDDGVRGFAERLKTYFVVPVQTKLDAEIVELIDSLVKEMTEDES